MLFSARHCERIFENIEQTMPKGHIWKGIEMEYLLPYYVSVIDIHGNYIYMNALKSFILGCV